MGRIEDAESVDGHNSVTAPPSLNDISTLGKNMLSKKFVHLTKSIEDLVSIIDNGLFIRARRRNVWKYFTRNISKENFKEREPQQFGMTCVHEFRFKPSRQCLQNFGHYGVILSPKWIEKNNFQKVIYLRENSRRHKILQKYFDEALIELEQILDILPKNDAFPLMGYNNHVIAKYYGAKKWCDFLEFYELLEPAKHRYQSEWRFSRKEPYYHQAKVPELKEDIKTRDGWLNITDILPFEPDDIEGILLPKEKKKAEGFSGNEALSSKPILFC